jgi:hypothetical protein
MKQKSFLFFVIALALHANSWPHAVTEKKARALCHQLKERYPHEKVMSYEMYVHTHGGRDVFVEHELSPLLAYHDYLQELRGKLEQKALNI